MRVLIKHNIFLAAFVVFRTNPAPIPATSDAHTYNANPDNWEEYDGHHGNYGVKTKYRGDLISNLL